MQEDPEYKTEYIPLQVPLGVLLQRANASRLIWDEYTKIQSISNDSRCLRSELQGALCSSSKSGSSGSGVRGRAKSSGGGVRYGRLGDVGIAGIAVRLPIGLVKVLRQTARYVLDRVLDHLLNQEPLPRSAGRC
jgi:hypothetical protein